MTLLQVAPEPLAPSSNARPLAGAAVPDTDFDRRWAAWLARGHADDVRTSRRMTWVAWLVGAGIVSWPAWAPALLGLIAPEHV